MMKRNHDDKIRYQVREKLLRLRLEKMAELLDQVLAGADEDNASFA